MFSLQAPVMEQSRLAELMDIRTSLICSGIRNGNKFYCLLLIKNEILSAGSWLDIIYDLN
jgi:hypothetical protein